MSFVPTIEIRRTHLHDFLEAWITGRTVPHLPCNVGHILRGTRNAWLGQFQINVRMPRHEIIRSEITRARDGTAAAVSKIAARVRGDTEFDFDACQREEADGVGAAYMQGVARMFALHMRMARGENVDVSEFMNDLWTTCMHSRHQLGRHSVPEDLRLVKYLEFLKWPGLREMPCNRIASHLWAAVFRKQAAGQKRDPSRGMARDIDAISTYAPYVDGMFVDNECATFLNEEPLRTNLHYRSRIFSLYTKDEFLKYLMDLNASVSGEQLEEARQRFGPEV